MHRKTIYISILLAALAAPAHAKELNAKLEKTAQKLAAAAAQQPGAARLAVFPFQADEKLSRRKANFAVSEILTNYLLKQGGLKVIERAQLEEVMKEQKLGVSGTVDSTTATRIGKLMGTNLLVLGNITAMGPSYQITVKLVDGETGELLTSEILEVPIETFNDDARQYLVSEIWKVGFYLAFGMGPAPTKKLGTTAISGGKIVPSNPDSDCKYVGGGLKYYFSPGWLADAAFMPMGGFNTKLPVMVVPNSNPANRYGPIVTMDLRLTRVSLSRIFSLSEKFKAQTGAGMMVLRAYPRGDEINEQVAVPGGDTVEFNLTGQTFSTPFARLGLEWKPQPRLGLSLVGAVNTAKKDFQWYATSGGARILFYQFAFPSYTLEGNVSLLF